jgi:hypothetical protein
VDPPPDVLFALQDQSRVCHQVVRSGAGDLTFEATAEPRLKPDGHIVFYGSFVHGPPDGRFLYVNSGKHAGEAASCWDRRAKIHLSGITAEQVDAVRSTPGAVLAITIPGRSRDGGPICASIKPHPEWRVAI